VKRTQAAVGLVVTIALGLASRRFPIGAQLWDKSLGDVLYAVMVYFLVAFARPALGPRALGGVSLAISISVELFQLTGIPRQLPRIARLALGTTFAWHDVGCYVVGALGAAAVHELVRSRASRRA
jgi:Protein of unknown function (DUF2809)